MSRYVYALVADPPRGDAGPGLEAETLRFVGVGGLLAAVGDMAAAPPVSAATLLAHDAVVRRLAAAVDAILPVRFGTLLADDAALAEAVDARAARLREALALVAGREQMTLRVFGEPAPVADVRPSEALAPGTRYLEARRRQAQRAAEVPELAPLRPHLAPLVRAERAERHGAPPLLASVYHLVDRGAAAAYRAALDAAPRSIRVVASGPWPPYAFAPQVLG